MAISSISGNSFKKMIMKGTGTKGYLSSSVQKAVREVDGGKLLNKNAKVSRQQATKVMKALKNKGLANKTGATATNYVKRGFAQEEHRKDMIKQQNIAERNQALADEKKAAAVKAGENKKATGGKTNQVSYSSEISSQNISHKDSFVGSNYGSTNLKSKQELPTQVQKPQEWIDEEANIIDLAID